VSFGVVLLIVRLALAVAFALAALGKLARREETEATLAKFGVGEARRAPLALAIPVAELAIAAGLVPAATSPVAAGAAFLLLAVFTVGVARVLGGEEEVDCNCFGALAPSRVSGWTLVRNGALMAGAGLVAVGGWSHPGPDPLGWVGGVSATAAIGVLAGLALLAAAANFAFSWQLMKQNGRLLGELATLSAGSAPSAGLAPGELAPAFALPELSGKPVELDELLDGGRGLLLFFSDPRCGACEPLLPEVGRLQRDPHFDPWPIVISLGDHQGTATMAAEHGLRPVLLQEDFELARTFGITGMPGAIVLDREGRVVGGPATGGVAVGELLASLSEPLRLVKIEAGAR
jgi:peroxiredoxin